MSTCWIDGEVKREPSGYSDQIELLTYTVTDGKTSETLVKIPYPVGTTDADLAAQLI